MSKETSSTKCRCNDCGKEGHDYCDLILESSP